MSKASTNAGIHPYLKPDGHELFKHIKKYEQGIILTREPVKFMNNIVNTEYKDSKGKDLYFKDEVMYKNDNYHIDYDSKNFRWVLKNNKAVVTLRDAYKSTLLVKKCQFR